MIIVSTSFSFKGQIFQPLDTIPSIQEIHRDPSGMCKHQTLPVTEITSKPGQVSIFFCFNGWMAPINTNQKEMILYGGVSLTFSANVEIYPPDLQKKHPLALKRVDDFCPPGRGYILSHAIGKTSCGTWRRCCIALACSCNFAVRRWLKIRRFENLRSKNLGKFQEMIRNYHEMTRN